MTPDVLIDGCIIIFVSWCILIDRHAVVKVGRLSGVCRENLSVPEIEGKRIDTDSVAKAIKITGSCWREHVIPRSQSIAFVSEEKYVMGRHPLAILGASAEVYAALDPGC